MTEDNAKHLLVDLYKSHNVSHSRITDREVWLFFVLRNESYLMADYVNKAVEKEDRLKNQNLSNENRLLYWQLATFILGAASIFSLFFMSMNHDTEKNRLKNEISDLQVKLTEQESMYTQQISEIKSKDYYQENGKLKSENTKLADDNQKLNDRYSRLNNDYFELKGKRCFGIFR